MVGSAGSRTLHHHILTLEGAGQTPHPPSHHPCPGQSPIEPLVSGLCLQKQEGANVVRVTPTQPHTRRSSYKFFPDPRGIDGPIFVRRTAANQPPTQHPQSTEVRWLRDRFAWANRVWSTFTSDQRSFYRGIALEVTTSMGGGRLELKLLSGQELFIAMMMKIRGYGQYLSLVPQKWNLQALDTCGRIFADVDIEVYSKRLKRTVVRMTGDGTGLFQWISLPPWGAPYRVCYSHPDLGKICWQYTSLEDLFLGVGDYLVHPVANYNFTKHNWSYAQDPVWTKKYCEDGLYSRYDFEDSRPGDPDYLADWTDAMLQVMPVGNHIYACRWKAGIHVTPNAIFWKDNIIFNIGIRWRPYWSAWKFIDGRTGLEVEIP